MNDIKKLLIGAWALLCLVFLRWAQREMNASHPDANYVTLRIRHWEDAL